MPPVEAIDVFCGAGGLSVGLAAAGISVVAGIEWDDDALGTWSNAHPNSLALGDDVNSVDWRRFDGVSLVVGGPPCQPWSIGGLRKGDKDERDGWPAFIAALRALRPRAFLAENVAGLTQGAMAPRWGRLVEELSDVGYKVSATVVNAADYGVPQKRRRCIVVGFQGPGHFVFPAPAYGAKGRRPWRTAGNVLKGRSVGRAQSGDRHIRGETRYPKGPLRRPCFQRGRAADRPRRASSNLACVDGWQQDTLA